MNNRIGLIMCGHSQYNDEIWYWLGERRISLEPKSNAGNDLNSYDYILALGIFVLCGCKVEYEKENDVVYIYYDGKIKELIKSMNEHIKTDKETNKEIISYNKYLKKLKDSR